MIDNITTFTYSYAWASDELELTWSESYEEFFGLVFWNKRDLKYRLEGISDN